jgi:hypothetical protein
MRRVLGLTACFVACGDDGNRHIVDAPLQTDGPAIDTPAQLPVTLTITLNAMPNAGVHVYFQNADSSVVAMAVTDVTGTASAVLAAGGYVTAVNPFTLPPFFGGQDELDTFAGVKPGDHLVLHQATTTQTQFTATVPFDPNNAATYHLEGTCGVNAILTVPATGGNPTGTAFSNTCATADLMVVTETINGDPIDYFFKEVTGLDISNAVVDLTQGGYTAATTRAFTFNNIPLGVAQLTVSDTSVSGHGDVYTTQFGGVTYANAGMPQDFKAPTFTDATHVVQSDVVAQTLGHQHFIDWGPYAPYTIDVSSRLLTSISQAPTFDPASHTIAWTELASGVTPDFALSSLFANRTTPARSWRWTIAAPRSATSITLPVLPTDIFDFNIAAGDNVLVASLVTAKVPGGYDAVRANVLTANGPTELVHDATGAITYQDVRLTLTRLAHTIPRVFTGSRDYMPRRR